MRVLSDPQLQFRKSTIVRLTKPEEKEEFASIYFMPKVVFSENEAKIFPLRRNMRRPLSKVDRAPIYENLRLFIDYDDDDDVVEWFCVSSVV